MTFAQYEEGPEGYPIELYLFKRGVSERYTMTSHDENITYESEVYQALQMERSKLEQTGEMQKSGINIKMQRDADILSNFVAFPPTEIMTLTIFRYHANDTPTPEVVVSWRGRVLSATWKGSEAILEAEPIFTSLKRPGLRRKYQSQCPHILYGGQCKVNNLLFQTMGTLTGVSNNTITSPAFAVSSDYFRGGYLQFDNRELRAIIADDGAGTLTLNSFLGELEVGSIVDVYPGCGHDLGDCQSKFNNLLNYGGFPYVPGNNPFTAVLF